MYPVVELSGSARGGGGGSGIPVYPKKFAKIPQNTQNSSKYTQNKFKENDIPNTCISAIYHIPDLKSP